MFLDESALGFVFSLSVSLFTFYSSSMRSCAICVQGKGERESAWERGKQIRHLMDEKSRYMQLLHESESAQPHGIFHIFNSTYYPFSVPVYSFDVCISKLEVNVKQIFGNQKSKRCLNRWDDKVQAEKNERSELQILIASHWKSRKWVKLKGGGEEVGGGRWRMKWKSEIWRNEPFFRFNLLSSKCDAIWYVICHINRNMPAVK